MLYKFPPINCLFVCFQLIVNPINLLKSPTKSRSPIISSIVTSNLHCAWHWNQTQSSAPQVFLFFFFTDLMYNTVKIHIINKLLSKYNFIYNIYIQAVLNRLWPYLKRWGCSSTFTCSLTAFLFKQFSFSSYNHKVKYNENLIHLRIIFY